jgi:hypothetical protein
MRPVTVAAFLVLPLVLLGCSSKPRVARTAPFLMPEDGFKKRGKILAVAPVEIPPGLPDAAPVLDEFSSLIDEELNRYGYSVVRPQHYTATWNKIAAEMGDFGIPGSGERDEVKVSRAMFRTMADLDAGFELDGVLFPYIVVVEAAFGAGSAVWDGAEQKIETAGAMESFFAGSQRGVVGALSLRVSIRDGEGNALFTNYGGIEVLSTMAGKAFVNVPREGLFADKERNRKAVEIALEPLKR